MEKKLPVKTNKVEQPTAGGMAYKMLPYVNTKLDLQKMRVAKSGSIADNIIMLKKVRADKKKITAYTPNRLFTHLLGKFFKGITLPKSLLNHEIQVACFMFEAENGKPVSEATQRELSNHFQRHIYNHIAKGIMGMRRQRGGGYIQDIQLDEDLI